MHDSRLEDQIRTSLRIEGDGVPLTITTAELERRLALRRRERDGRRLTLMAAAVAVIAVGSIIALGNGWLRMPSVGTDTSPSPAPTRQSQDGASTLGPIGATPGRTELFRADPDDTAARPMQPFVVPAEGDWVLGTIACLGDGEVHQSVEPDVAVNLHCLPDRVVESEGWFSVIDGQVRGNLASTDGVQYAFLVESPGPGDTPPATEASPTPTATPIPTPRVAPDLGGPTDAVLVGVTDSEPPHLEVTVAKTLAENVGIGEFPIPSGFELELDRARVGPTGYLAIPISDFEGATPGVVVYDLASPGAEPVRVDGGSGGSGWAPDGGLTFLDALTVTVVDPSNGQVRSVTPVPAGVVVASAASAPIWAADGSGILGSRIGVASSDTGILGLDGEFTVDPSPDLFAPMISDRIYDTQGRTIGTGCDSSGPGGPEASCAVNVSAPGDETLEHWYSGNDIRDQAWAADGRQAWLLLDDWVNGEAAGDLRLQRGTAESFEPVATLSGVERSDAVSPRLGGFTADDGRVAVVIGNGMTALADTATDTWYAINGTFAGWADQSGATYPAP